MLAVVELFVVVSVEDASVVNVVVEVVVEVVVVVVVEGVVEVAVEVVVELPGELELSTFVEFSNTADVNIGIGVLDVVDVSTTEVDDDVASVVVVSSSLSESNKTSLC